MIRPSSLVQNRERGVSAAQYGIMIVLIAAAIMVTALVVGDDLLDAFNVFGRAG